MSGRLEGKIALITGGANGIGEATAVLFAKEGASVIIADIDDQKGADLASSIGAYNLHLDVSIEADWSHAVKVIMKEFTKLDILVNNAGVSSLNNNEKNIQDPENMSIDTWHRIHNINLDSIFLGCKYAISLMKENHNNCSIVNIASRSGIVGVPGLSAYASSKAAIRNYSKSVALYCAYSNYKIRCNTVSPAAISTNMWAHKLSTDDKNKNLIANSIPLKRMGEPIDVAKAILYLSSDESLFVTGAELIVDGGILSVSTALPTN